MVRVRIVRPASAGERLPVVMYFHGGGWALGDAATHDRLVREIAAGAQVAVVFVETSRAPEARFPVPLEEAYAATKYVAERGIDFALDGSRLAIAGDGTGGTVAAGVTLLAKARREPSIAFQLLFYPVTDSGLGSASYKAFRDGPWLTRDAMARAWNAYLPNNTARLAALASPLRASCDELRGLPAALIVTAENDVVRDEGEAYATKLADACVRVTATRYIGAMHDFVMLNALADTAAARSAIRHAVTELSSALE
jgi:acetyl esterase